MIRTYLFVFMAGFFLTISCSNNSEKRELASAVSELEAIVLSDSTSLFDKNKALELLDAYENYANALPQDSLAPEYLYKGAEIAMNLQLAGRAIEYHQRILNNYSNFDKRSYSLFLQAFIYENQLQQYETAKSLYLEFIETYPDHPLADDAEVSVENMGKSLEDLIKSWETEENN